MRRSVRIIIEGDKRLLEGFSAIFAESKRRAAASGVRLQLMMAGKRRQAFDTFRAAVGKDPDVINLLLVDSEEAVDDHRAPWTHLARRQGDGWTKPDGASDEHCHLMIETMESWLFADLRAVDQYFKNDRGKDNPIQGKSKNTDLISKSLAMKELDRLALSRFRKRYDKIDHGVDLLLRVDPAKLRANSPSFNRLQDSIDAAST